MSTRRSVSISLSPELQAVAEGLLATGRYGNISDVMRTALRLLEERELNFRAHKEGVENSCVRFNKNNGVKGIDDAR